MLAPCSDAQPYIEDQLRDGSSRVWAKRRNAFVPIDGVVANG